MTPDSPSAPFQHLTLTLTKAQYEAVFDALLCHSMDLERDVKAGYEDATPELQAAQEAHNALVDAAVAAGFTDWSEDDF